MVTSKSTLKPVTVTQARAIVKAFKIDAKVNHARVTSLLPHVGKSATTIIDEIYLAYGDVSVPYAIGESTIQTALNVATAWASMSTSARAAVDKADEVLIFDMLVQVRRSLAKLPDGKIPAGVAVKRELTGKTKHIIGGERALSHIVTALVKQTDGKRWLAIVTGAHEVIHRQTLSVRRAGKPVPAEVDAIEDVATEHNGRAADARTGDKAATKNNDKAHRASKNERKSTVTDPLTPASEGNSEDKVPGATSGERKPAPAQTNPLADMAIGKMIAEINKRLVLGYVPTGAEDLAMTELAATWSARVEDAPAKMAGKYLERATESLTLALAGSVK